MPRCTILVGLPATGKSTWLNFPNGRAYNVLSSDDIIEHVGRNHGSMTYNEAWPLLNKFAEAAFFNKLKSTAEFKVDCYIDRTNLTVKSRRRIIDIFKPHNYYFEAVVFEIPPLHIWEQRLNNRPGKSIPNEVLVNMKNMFQMPTEDEGFLTIRTAMNNV